MRQAVVVGTLLFVFGAARANPPDPRATLKMARIAYVDGRHAEAIMLAREVLAVQPNNQNAWQIVGSSACYSNKVHIAHEAYNHMSTSGNARLLRSVCNRKGISLGGTHAPPRPTARARELEARAEGKLLRARQLYSKGKRNRAHKVLREVLKMVPPKSASYQVAYRCLAHNGACPWATKPGQDVDACAGQDVDPFAGQQRNGANQVAGASLLR